MIESRFYQHIKEPSDDSVEELVVEISPVRLFGIAHTTDDPKAALAIYAAHTELCQVLSELLSHFEVALRNRTVIEIQKFYGSPEWYDDERFLGLLHKRRREKFEADLIKIRQRHGPLTSDRVCSKQTLGFWVEFYRGRLAHEFWQPSLHNIWRKGTALAALRSDLIASRDLRNHIAHHESLFAKNRADALVPPFPSRINDIAPHSRLWWGYRNHQKFSDAASFLTSFRNW